MQFLEHILPLVSECKCVKIMVLISIYYLQVRQHFRAGSDYFSNKHANPEAFFIIVVFTNHDRYRLLQQLQGNSLRKNRSSKKFSFVRM